MALIGAPTQLAAINQNDLLVTQPWATWLLELVSTVNGLNTALGFVPYLGATQDLNLGSHNILAANLSGTNTGDQAIILTGGVTGTWAGGAIPTTVVDIGTCIGTQLTLSGALIEPFQDMQIRGMTFGLGSGAQVTNLALGYQTLLSGTSGTGNVGIGYQTLLTCSSGFSNTAIGYWALRKNSTTQNNTAVGYKALPVNNSDFNTGLGADALFNLFSGSGNTAVGYQAGYGITTGTGNTAIGRAVYSGVMTGDYNTAVGLGSFPSLTTGSFNTAVGVGAGGNTLTGNENILLGYNTTALAIGNSNFIVIGANSEGLGSNTTVLGNSSTTFGRWWGRLLLGTSTDDAASQLQVTGNTVLTGNLTITGNAVLGNAATDTLNVGNGGVIKDANNNIGISCTPAAWQAASSGNAAIQMGNASFAAIADLPYMQSNSYWDGTNFRAISTAVAARININGLGDIKWFSAPSVAAGSAQTFTARMTLAIGGELTTHNTTDVTSSTAASVMMAGGLAVAKSVFIGGNLVLPKTSGVGIKVDPAAATFGWRDMLGQIVTKAAGANDPVWAVYRGTIRAYQFSNALMNETWVILHLPHDYVPGTDIHVHAHWSQITVDTGGAAAVPGVCKWYFDVSYAKGHGTAGGAADAFNAVITQSVTQQGSTTQYGHMVAEVNISSAAGDATHIANTRFEPDGILLVRCYRDAADAADTLNQTPFLHMVDGHYQSTNIGTKQKSSAGTGFYV